MTCKFLQKGLWCLENVWREKTKAAFCELPDPSLYGGCWKRCVRNIQHVPSVECNVVVDLIGYIYSIAPLRDGSLRFYSCP